MPGEVIGSEAPAGDIATAIMHIDGLLRRAHAAAADGSGQADAPPVLLSLDEQRDAFDGTCSLIYLFTTVFREAAEAEGEDVLATVVPELVRTLGYMKENVAAAAIPMMAAMVTAAALGMSPNLWRLRYGPWQPEDVKAVQATAMVLAEKINSAADSHDAALRMVMDIMERAEGEDGESGTP
jgi:hypothetical protein